MKYLLFAALLLTSEAYAKSVPTITEVTVPVVVCQSVESAVNLYQQAQLQMINLKSRLYVGLPTDCKQVSFATFSLSDSCFREWHQHCATVRVPQGYMVVVPQW